MKAYLRQTAYGYEYKGIEIIRTYRHFEKYFRVDENLFSTLDGAKRYIDNN